MRQGSIFLIIVKKLLFVVLYLFFLTSIKASSLSIQNGLFFLNNKPFEMYGIRTASATQSEQLTEHLISQLDDYVSIGLNTISIYLQGSSGGYSDPFIDGGNKLEKNHKRRLFKIIEECDKRSMVVIVGIFYQRVFQEQNTHIRKINSEEAVINGVKTTTHLLKPFNNVIINIANEQKSKLYASFKAFDFNDPYNIIKLCKIVKETDKNRIVGGGGYHDASNVTFGKSNFVDVLLFDTFPKDVAQQHTSGWHYNYFVENGVKGKPIVNVELFGGWTKIAMPQGVFSDSVKTIYLQEIIDAKKIPGLYVHFHSNPWCQPDPKGVDKVRYDLAGKGTKDDPGIRWWFEKIEN